MRCCFVCPFRSTCQHWAWSDGVRTLAGVIRWFGPLGCLWRPTGHTIFDGVGVVAFRVNLVKNVIEGVYNKVFVVKLNVYI